VYGLDMTLRLTDGKLTAVVFDSADSSDTELTLTPPVCDIIIVSSSALQYCFIR